MHVLLVDDEPLVLEQMEHMIKKIAPAWHFHKAPDAAKALALSQQYPIKLALLDINLSGLTGLELAEELLQLYTEMDIIMVTAYQSFDYVKKAIRIGVVDYLTKPVIESELQDLLSKYSKRTENYSTLICQAMSYIHENFAEKLSLIDVANSIHTNATYLSRRFHEELGVPFSEYVIHYRIQVSKRLLVEHPDWSISETAERSGFNSQHYFSTIFKKIERTTPSEYRVRGK